jgi:ABC-type lipoprotein release transport system permease subunit
MTMWFDMKLAWRNIFRNKRRTFISGIAIGVGLAAMIFTDALMLGMKVNMIKSATESFLGEGQIYRQGFRLTFDVNKTINRLDWVVSHLEKEPALDKFTLRTAAFGMITSPADVSSVMFYGIYPPTERYLSQIDDVIEKGNYFEGDDERNIVIGSGLAEMMEVGIGDRVVITVTQAHSGDLVQELFRVSGIYKFNVKEMDTGMAFVRLSKAQEMLGIGKNAHQIALKFKDIRFAARKDNPFWSTYRAYGNEAVSWTVLLPQLNAMLGMFWISLLVMGIILFGIVAFGIINTLFMSLYERMFEFGVIRAIGTRPSGVRRLILLEAGALSLLSIILGMIIGFAITVVFIKVGIDYRGIEIAGTSIHEMLYPVIHIQQYIIYPLAVFGFTLLIGLYPAAVASKMSISEALRKSL